MYAAEESIRRGVAQRGGEETAPLVHRAPASRFVAEGADRRNAPAVSGVAATAFPSATDAAVEVLKAGGNAIDAAVAAAWALVVCEPSGSGLGGQTVALIRLAGGRTFVIDGRSRAPAGVSRQTVSKQQQRTGFRACTVPTTPATLAFAHRRYGLLAPQRVMEPAIRLAEAGYPVTRLQRRQLRWCLASLRSTRAAAELFLRRGKPYRAGEIFRQPRLAATLRRLAAHGPEDFYRGRLARDIVADMRANGGLITARDLAELPGPVEREPVTATYRGRAVFSIPPPGGGLDVLVGLRVLEAAGDGSCPVGSDDWHDLMLRVIAAVFEQRELWPVHPRDATPSLYRWLLSDERAREMAAALHADGPPAGAGRTEEPGETTHVCAADAEGNAVSLTQSIQSLFGAKVANGRLGFLYNNYLCTCPRRGHRYQLAAGCVPRSNAAPTLVLSGPPGTGGGPAGWRLALGAAGSRRIVSAVLQTIAAVTDGGLSAREAVAVPRVHVLPGGRAMIERPAAGEALLARLAHRRVGVFVRAPNSYSMGAVQAVETDRSGVLAGAADPRREGTAASLPPAATGGEGGGSLR